MKKGIKRTLRIAGFSLASFVVIFLLVVTVLLHFIFTPARITPIVNEVANRSLAADVKIGSVELTFFSTFPDFGLQVKEGAVTPYDSITPLVSFSEATVVVNPVAFLKGNKVRVKKIALEDPHIYLFVDSLGNSTLDVFMPDSVVADSADSVSTVNIADIDIKSIRLERGMITLDDRNHRLFANIYDANLDLKGHLSKRIAALKADFSIGNFFLWQEGKVVFRKIALGVQSDLVFNRDSLLLKVNKARVDVNGLAMGMQGTLRADSVAKTVDVDLGMGLHTPSLEEFLRLIPGNLVKPGQKMTTKGEVTFIASLKGVYGKGIFPEASASLKIADASARYNKMKWGIDKLTADMELFVDLSKKKSSYLNINRFLFAAGNATAIDLKGKVTNLLTSPEVGFELTSGIDFEHLTRIFPLQPGVELKGTNRIQMKGAFKYSDIEHRDYGKIFLDGSSSFHDLLLSFDGSELEEPDSSYFYMMMKEGDFFFGNHVTEGKLRAEDSNLTASIRFSGLGFRNKERVRVSLNDIGMLVDSDVAKDSTQITRVYTELSLGGVSAEIPDTLNAYLSHSKVALELLPYKGEVRRPMLKMVLNTDSLYFASPPTDTRLFLSSAGFDLSLLPPERKRGQWGFDGNVGFSNLKIYSALYPVEIAMPSTQVTFKDRSILLNNTRLKVGESDMWATGNIDNLLPTLLRRNRNGLRGSLAIRSKMIDLNELLMAMNESIANLPDEEDTEMEIGGDDSVIAVSGDTGSGGAVDETELAADAPDDGGSTAGMIGADNTVEESNGADAGNADNAADGTENTGVAENTNVPAEMNDADTVLTLIQVPRRIDFVLDLAVDKMKIADIEVEDIRGKATLRHGTIRLDNLDLRAMDAPVHTSLYYRNHGAKSAEAAFNLNVKDVDISRIGTFLPAVDSMMPMLRSFEGIVNFDMVATGTLDSSMMLDIPSLSSVISLSGTRLVLMDSETFKTVSKMLMFKNKERNMIDSLGLYVIAREGVIDVVPFEAAIDRYRFIVGGTQTFDPATFDLNFKYNVSIMKSPLPFKAGVDIFGNLEDFDFKITKAKLKRTDFGVMEQNVDSIRQVLLKQIP